MRLRPLSRVEYALIAGIVGFVLLSVVSPLAAGGAVLLVWMAGPLAVGCYLVGLGLGWFSSDGLPMLVAGGLFSLLWLVGALAVTIRGIGGGLRALLYVWTIVFDILALGAGRAAIKRG